MVALPELTLNPPYNLTAQHPDDFIIDLLDLHAARVCEAASNHRRSPKNPPKSADEYLDTLLSRTNTNRRSITGVEGSDLTASIRFWELQNKKFTYI